MKTTVINIRKNRDNLKYVYIGRGSEWGNPFIIGEDGGRNEVIQKFSEYFLSSPVLVARAKKELAGKVLGCYCKPQACHGDIIAEVIDNEN
jgi:hypothetical protein